LLPLPYMRAAHEIGPGGAVTHRCDSNPRAVRSTPLQTRPPRAKSFGGAWSA
jgi:hypothetical protein